MLGGSKSNYLMRGLNLAHRFNAAASRKHILQDGFSLVMAQTTNQDAK